MDVTLKCGCKGCRTCLICEKYTSTKQSDINKQNGTYVYCSICEKAYPGWNIEDIDNHNDHVGAAINFPGVYIKLDFLNALEEADLLNCIDSMPWDLSQSGRRKQNFGPKCNFKKRKLCAGNFNGFPKFAKFVQDKFSDVYILKGFKTIEQCSLEYDPRRGSSIDPHVDDCWIWGERIVTVNLLSDSVLTMTYNYKSNCYNLDCVKNYASILSEDGQMNCSSDCYKLKMSVNEQWPLVRIPMPRRSLLVLYGSARYNWEHRILREDILRRRICLAYREFTPTFLPQGEKYSDGKPVLEKSSLYVNTNL